MRQLHAVTFHVNRQQAHALCACMYVGVVICTVATNAMRCTSS